MQARLAVGIVLWAALPAAAGAPEWPGFRGPRHGVSDERGLPERWSATEGVAWKANVPGAGWSSPIVAGDRVLVTTATEDGVSCRMLAFDRRSGALLWNEEAFRQTPTRKESMNSYATPTPVTDGERVYAVFGEGGVAAFSMEGRVLWTNTEHPFYSQHGLGASPILVDGLLIQPRDGSSDGEDKAIGWQKPWDRSYLLALDARTGRTRYRAHRGLSRIAHVTPAVVTVNGQKQVVSPAGDVVQGFEPATGRLLWTARSEGEGVVPSVVVAGDLVVTASGFGDPALRAFRLGGSGDVTARHLAWEQKKAVPMVSSPVVAAGLVFVVKENGIASALDAPTGAVVWQKRLPGGYSASPVAADGKVYFLGEDCETSIVAVAGEWHLLGGAKLPGRCQASMAVAGGRLFIRTDTEIYAIGR
jgi:outer membrane protein assembly factor BamB